MEFAIIGIVSAINLIVIVTKFRKGRVEDGVFDSALFVLLALLFSGSYGGMVVAMIGSMIISMYLLFYPPTFFRQIMSNDTAKETVKEVKTTITKLDPEKTKEWLKFLGWGLGFAAIVMASFIAIPALIIIGLVAIGGALWKAFTTSYSDIEDSTK